MKKQTVSFQFDTTPAPIQASVPHGCGGGRAAAGRHMGPAVAMPAPGIGAGPAGAGRSGGAGPCCGTAAAVGSEMAAGCPLRSAAGAVGGGHTAAEPHQRCSGGTGRLVGPVALSADRAVHAALCGGGQRLVDAAACGGCNGPCCGSCAAAALADMAGGRLRSRTAGAASGGPCAGGWWFTCFLLGVLLCFVQGSAIGRRAKAVTAGALALVLLIGLLPEGLSGGASPTALGRRWARPCTAGAMRMPADPLPEGDISGSGAFSPDRSRRCG